MSVPFLFTSEHDQFRESVRDLARREFLDSYLERARGGRFPLAEQKQLGAAGLLGLVVSEDDGGQGADPIYEGIACEEVGYADMAMGHLVFNGNVSSALIAGYAQADVKAEWLPGALAGDVITALALTEPGSGSDAAAMRAKHGGLTEAGYYTARRARSARRHMPTWPPCSRRPITMWAHPSPLYSWSRCTTGQFRGRRSTIPVSVLPAAVR